MYIIEREIDDECKEKATNIVELQRDINDMRTQAVDDVSRLNAELGVKDSEIAALNAVLESKSSRAGEEEHREGEVMRSAARLSVDTHILDT